MADHGRGSARQPKPQHRQQPRFDAKPGASRHQPARNPRGKPGFRADPRIHSRTPHELDPRKVAHAVLSRLEPGELLDAAVDREMRKQGFDAAQSHRVLAMLEDAVRFGLLFNALIAHVATRPPEALDRDVRAALHLFLAWYLIDDPNAVYAHGQAAVDLLPPDSKSRGFVNACVRRLGEFVRVEMGPREDYRQQTESATAPQFWREKARLGRGRFVVAKLPVFPDFEKDPAAHLATVCALPRWFIDQLIEQHGMQGAVKVALSAVEEPPTWVRVNKLRGNANELQSQWQMSGLEIERVGEALRLPAHTNVTELPGFGNGAFYVQDLTSQQIAPALGAKASEAILDLCAAPGGKSGHLAEITGDRARILACDVSADKIARIHDNVTRMGYTCVSTVMGDARSVRFPERFDRVLLDAPCSNSGVLGRRVEARHRLDAATVTELARVQMNMLENAAFNLMPGGTLVYSVCSILMEEGVDLVRFFLSARAEAGEPGSKNGGMQREEAGWELQEEKIILPTPAYCDGMYWCRLKAPG